MKNKEGEEYIPKCPFCKEELTIGGAKGIDHIIDCYQSMKDRPITTRVCCVQCGEPIEYRFMDAFDQRIPTPWCDHCNTVVTTVDRPIDEVPPEGDMDPQKTLVDVGGGEEGVNFVHSEGMVKICKGHKVLCSACDAVLVDAELIDIPITERRQCSKCGRGVISPHQTRALKFVVLADPNQGFSVPDSKDTSEVTLKYVEESTFGESPSEDPPVVGVQRQSIKVTPNKELVFSGRLDCPHCNAGIQIVYQANDVCDVCVRESDLDRKNANHCERCQNKYEEGLNLCVDALTFEGDTFMARRLRDQAVENAKTLIVGLDLEGDEDE